MSEQDGSKIQCHYDVLGVSQDADTSTIKKAHRKLALKHHPDKNIGNDTAADQFRLVQIAYEVLSDPQERKWYDDHRDAILAGWSTGGGEDDAAATMLFEVVHYMHPGCYTGYHDGNDGFYSVYTGVFENIVQCERRQSQVNIELPTEFGNSETDWSSIQLFYHTWESFVSQLNFAWEDKYNVNEDAPSRRVRRLMEEENNKARRKAKKTYNQDILALVAFVKRRDPRVKAKKRESEQQKQELAKKQKEEAAQRKRENMRAKEAWKEEAQREMEVLEEADRLMGRVRLADLEDDYDYGGGKKRGKKNKKKRRSQVEEEEEDHEDQPCDTPDEGVNDIPEAEEAPVDNEETNQATTEGTPTEEKSNTEIEKGEANEDQPCDTTSEVVNDTPGAEAEDPCDNEETTPASIEEMSTEEKSQTERHESSPDDFSESDYSDSEEDEPDIWRCECCKKDFKSEGQMANHMKSKKHKENLKKYEAKMKREEEEEIMDQMLGELDLESS
jgi:DnaJ family protein A protein 5